MLRVLADAVWCCDPGHGLHVIAAIGAVRSEVRRLQGTTERWRSVDDSAAVANGCVKRQRHEEMAIYWRRERLPLVRSTVG